MLAHLKIKETIWKSDKYVEVKEKLGVYMPISNCHKGTSSLQIFKPVDIQTKSPFDVQTSNVILPHPCCRDLRVLLLKGNLRGVGPYY